MPRTLTGKCLGVIIEHFDALMSDYLSESGCVPKEHFYFLQLKFSRKLLKLLLRKRKLPDSYYTFLINKHIKKLEVTSDTQTHNIDFSVLLQRLTEVGDRIVVLNLKQAKYSEAEIVSLISLVPNVQELDLSQTKAGDDVLKALGSSLFLKTLHINSCGVTDSGLEYLCNKNGDGEYQPNSILTYLSMDDVEDFEGVNPVKVTQHGVLFALMKFPSLKVVEHTFLYPVIHELYIKYASGGTVNSAQRFNLKSLNVSSYTVIGSDGQELISLSNVLTGCAFICPEVSCLTVRNAVTPADIQLCMLFNHLCELSLSGKVRHDPFTVSFLEFSAAVESCGRHLKNIYLEFGILSVDALLKCENLEVLSLYRIQLRPVSGSRPPQHNTSVFQNMRDLTFTGMERRDDVDDAIKFILECSFRLQSLNLPGYLGLSDEFVEKVCNYQCSSVIDNLDLSYSNVSITGMEKFLLCCKSLKIFQIRGCRAQLDGGSDRIVSFFIAKKYPTKIIGIVENDDDFEDLYELENAWDAMMAADELDVDD